jgi:RHS repeat-associated protein/uncharacterized repeat protein (TIGR01451 family)
LPQGVHADNTSKLTVRGTISSVSVNPNLTLTLAVDKSTALPGDTLGYSGTVTHTGITACVNGSFSAQNTGLAAATVADFFDELDYWDANALKWVPLAGVVNTQTAFVPVVTPRISTGITLTVTSVPANGVTYPSSGNPIIGTTIVPGATAAWTGSVCVTLTAAQLNALFNAPKLQVESHFEDTPGDPSGEAWTSDQPCFNPLQSGFLNANNVVVTVTPPSGPPVQITKSTVPAFASLAVGASANYATTYRVPAATTRGTSETEAAYVARLTGLEAFNLKANASVTATGPTGPVSANAPPVSTIEHLPITSITKSGPAARDAGTIVSYQLALQNNGGAIASQLTVTDALSDGGSGTVGNVPATLAPAATSAATASYAIPAAAQPGTLTDTAAVTWKDANGNAYGSVSGSAATRITINGVPPEIQPVTSTTVQGNFFAEPASAQTFVAAKTDTPAFSQNFPTINFNPPAGVVPHNISAVGSQTRPFTDVTTDLVGNFAGTIPAQGGIYQAGVGPLQSFDAALQASFIVQAAGDVTFVIYHDDGFILGIGNAATRVSGVYVGPPAATAFAGYPVIGAFNQMVAAPRTDEVTVHFPTAGIYPYELDYFEAGADSLTLTLTTAPAPSGSTGASPGGVFVTGHDPDYHGYLGANAPGAQHIIQRAIAAVTRAKANPTVLLVTDLRNPGSGSSDPRLGMTAAGFAYAVADYGSGAAGVLDLHTVPFANYDVVVVASDFGGWLHQDELDILNARAVGLATYVSHGGGLVAFAESGYSGLTSSGRFGFLPCLNEVFANAGESGFQLTPIGQALGLVTSDVNGNAYHNVFSSPCGMDVVDFDPAGRPVTLTSTGVSRSWNIAHDFQLAPNQANPSNGGVWTYLQSGSNALDPSGYSKLPNFTSQAYSIAGLQQWTGTFASGGRADDMLSAAGVNASGVSQHPLTFVWPNGVFRVHPWTPAVVVGWTSPFTGTVHVEGAVTHLDQSCGDGVRWNVLSGSTKLASGQVTFGANAGQFLSEGTGGAGLNQISVTTGQSLYFVVDAGANGDFYCDSTALDVTVVEGPAPNTRPLPPANTLLIQPASVAATVGQGVTLTVSAMDGTGAPVAAVPVTVSVSGVNSLQQQVSTDAAGVARISYVGSAGGSDLVTATANVAGRLTVSNSATVTWNVPGPNPNLAPPSISAPSPADGTVVTKPVPITATIAPPAGQTLAAWSVTYQEVGTPTPVTLASGTGSPPSPLATFDPTLLLNDIYTLTMSATASGGGIQSLTSTVAVSGALKLGRYTATYQDLTVPVNGFQMEVSRTYDSGDKRVGDFGVGWRVSLTNFRVTANRQLGAGGWTEYPTSCTFGFCNWGFKSSAPHYVAVTFPDQHQELFDFTPQGGTGILYFQGTAGFTARAGTTSTLQALDTGLSNGFEGNLYGASGFYNPTGYKLTTHDGRVLILDTNLGLISETDRNGNSLAVDGSGVHASNGQGILFTRDGLARITQVTGPASGQAVRYTYSAAGDLATSTDPLGNTNTYVYDSGHALLKVSGAQGALSTATYDSAGRLTSITDALGHTTQIQNNVGAQTVAYTDAIGATTTVVTADDLGDIVREDISSGGQTLSTRFVYDSVGHAIQKTDPLGHTVSAGYDAQGNLIRYTDGGGNPTQFYYNDQGQITTAVAPDGATLSSATYDANGNPLAMLGPTGAVMRFTYDSSGRPLTRTDSAGNVLRYAYDATGRVSGITDPAGKTTGFQYDAGNRLVLVTDAIGNAAHFTYDGAGNVSGTSDGRGNAESFIYNPFGSVLSTTDPLGGKSTITYDANGRVTGTTDRAGNSNTYAYDADGRLTRVNYPGGEFLAFTIDGFGRPTTAANSSSTIDNSYDAAGNIVSTTTHAPIVGSVSLSYTYDAAGNRLTSTGPDGTTRYTYDSRSRVVSVADPRGGLFNLQYDSGSRITALTRPNGITDAYTYDLNGRLVAIASKLGGTTVQNLTQAFDTNGQVASRTDAAGPTTFTHDADGRLTSVGAPGAAAQAYAYDAAGNRTSGPFSSNSIYNAADELTSDTGFTYTYDAEGQRTSKTDRATGATTRYLYNGAQQLTSIQYADGTATTYTYDALGRRSTVSAGGTTTAYVYDGLDTRLEYGSAGLAASYVGASQIDRPLEMTRGANSYYYLQNFQGSVTGLANSSGTIAATYSSDAFGVPTSPQAPVTNPFTYTGREYDAKSGLYYNRARYYEPTTGSFISQDPIKAGHRYSYTGGDPVDFSDPGGASGVFDFAAIQKFFTTQFIPAIRSAGCVLSVFAALIELGVDKATSTPVNSASLVALGANIVTSCALAGLSRLARFQDPVWSLVLFPLFGALIAAGVDLLQQLWCSGGTSFSRRHIAIAGVAGLGTGSGGAVVDAVSVKATQFVKMLDKAAAAEAGGGASGVVDNLSPAGACG